MDDITRARFEARAKIMKSLAHPTRLFIVDELARNGPRCVRDLTDMIGADMSTVSKHLALLKDAGIVEDRKRGLLVYYRLRAPCIGDFFDCVEMVSRNNAEAQQKLVSRPQFAGTTLSAEDGHENPR